jgi:uncharacterized protein with PQ loop repeat
VPRPAARRTVLLVTDLLGWLSSAILVATIAKQVHKQWRAGSSEGVSRWLFVGQVAASTGFTIYSLLLGNAVFAVTNAVLLASAVAGLVLMLRHRRRERAVGTSPAAPRSARTA